MIPGAAAPEEPPIAIARETEIFPDGASKAIGTAFLRNGACPLACVYCALYRQASPGAAKGPPGSHPDGPSPREPVRSRGPRGSTRKR